MILSSKVFSFFNLQSKKYSLIVFLVAFVALFFIYQFDEILLLRPQSIHQWRQCDCLSITLNYYHEGVGFFEPQMHYLGKDGTGKTVSDCPIIYYSVAQLWKFFGYHEFVYRLVILIICCLGLAALMKTIEAVLSDSFIAIFISLLMYTSAILVYYSNNFLMNVPSFSLALIAIFFFYKFYKTQKSLFLWVSMFFYLLGGLLKIPALTSFVAILGAFVFEVFGLVKLKNGKKLFSRPALHILPFVIVIAIIITWYYYAFMYNQKYNSGIFLIGTLAIWDLSYERISTIIEHAWVLWFDSYHSPYIQYILVLLLITIFIFRKKVNKLLFLLTTFLAIGFTLFILLWFSVFDQHDYYLINQLIFMVAILFTFFHFLKIHHLNIYRNKWFRVLLLLILFHNVFHCSKIINMRYNGWPNDWHKTQFQALETITPYLDSIGVNHKDKVLFMNDGSFNIPLYLMDRKGYTAYWSTSKETVKERISIVDYFITNDSSTLEREEIRSLIDQQVGTYKNISIFSLKK